MPRQKYRGGRGTKVSSAPVAEAIVVDDANAVLMVMSARGQVLRTTVGQVPIRRREVLTGGRLSKGARLMRLDDGDLGRGGQRRRDTAEKSLLQGLDRPAVS